MREIFFLLKTYFSKQNETRLLKIYYNFLEAINVFLTDIQSFYTLLYKITERLFWMLEAGDTKFWNPISAYFPTLD
jgi:hypothetical protein